MKQLLFLLLIFLTACGHSRIRFGHKHHQDKKDVEATSIAIQPVDTLFFDAQAVHESPETILLRTEQPTLSNQAAVHGVDLNSINYSPSYLIRNYNLSELNQLRKDLKRTPISEAQDVRKKKGAIAMVIIGLFLVAGVGILFYHRQSINSVDSSSTGGCLASIIGIIAFFVIGILLGLGGLALVIIGLIIIKRVEARKMERRKVPEQTEE